MDKWENFRDTHRKAPRLTSLLPHFEKIALGEIQRPRLPVTAAVEFRDQSHELAAYCHAYERNMGPFWQHFCASIPYVLEEQCRVGSALVAFSKGNYRESSSVFRFYETSAAEGVAGRTLGEIGAGRIHTLSDSPNVGNMKAFADGSRHSHSRFHLGPFFDITPEYLRAMGDGIGGYEEGFDVIYENTTFQFYATNRVEQISYLKRVLREGGLLFCLEKVTCPSREEYDQREASKDQLFKAIYFSESEVSWKKASMLADMERCQISFAELTDAVLQNFGYAALLWNSGNFYEVVGSDSEVNLKRFCNLLQKPHVPRAFRCEGDLDCPRFL